MLSWSSAKTGGDADLTELADGHGDAGVDHGAALLRFATACAGGDDGELAAARRAIVDATDEAFMIDAAAVAANFEMMTRLADGTGARMPSAVIEERAAVIGVMHADTFRSRR